MPADVSQVRAFSRDLGTAAAAAAPLVRAVVVKGAVQVKAAMRADMQNSIHFKSIAHSIDFDEIVTTGGVAAEIGPRHGPGEPGNLANIAYFGTSRGGGTVRDPQEALDEEAPKFEKALGDVLEGLV